MSEWNIDPAIRALAELEAKYHLLMPTLTPEGHHWVARVLAEGPYRPPTDVIAYFGLDPETDWYCPSIFEEDDE